MRRELRAGGGALHAAEFNFAELEKHEAEYEAACKGLSVRAKASAAGTQGIM